MERARIIQAQMDHERELRDEPLRFNQRSQHPHRHQKTGSQSSGDFERNFDVERFAGQQNRYTDSAEDSDSSEDDAQRGSSSSHPDDDDQILLDIGNNASDSENDAENGEARQNSIL